MNLLEALTENIGDFAHLDHRAFQVGSRRLIIIRLLWFEVVGLVLFLFVSNLPAYYAFLHLPAPAGVLDNSNLEQLSLSGQQTLEGLGFSLDFYAFFRILVDLGYLLGFLLIGTLLFWYKPADRLAVLASITLVMFPCGNIYKGLPLTSPQVVIFHLLGHFGSVSLALVFYLFPDGRFVPSWTRWLLAGWFMREIVLFISEFPGTGTSSANLKLVPFLAIVANNGLFPLLLVSLVASQVYRYRRVSTSWQRKQTKWVVWGIGFSAAGVLSLITLINVFSELFQPGTVLYFISCAAFDLVLLAMPFSVGLAILRYQLWDIDIIINRTLVYGVLTAGIIGFYVITVGGLGVLLQAQGSLLISVIATGFVAVLFQPLRERLQHGVNRLMFGERDTPYIALTRLGQRLEATMTQEAVLPVIVETVAQALKLSYAAIKVKQGDDYTLAACYGSDRPSSRPGNEKSYPAMLRLPLVYQEEQIGELVLARRSNLEPFTPADRRLLNDLCRHIEVATHAVLLTARLKQLSQDLQQARERLVTAREEERRRLRRDLHDGLGPQLSSQALLLTSAQMLLEQDPREAGTILQSAVEQTQEAIADIRRLVYGLRPPALDDLGLVATIKEQFARNQGSGIAFTFDLPHPLPPLPAAVEVACFRIVQEGVTNVVRHSQARNCTVRLSRQENLFIAIEITDDGIGLPPGFRPGVGFTSMRERAEELGGRWQISILGETGGCKMVAQLPLH